MVCAEVIFVLGRASCASCSQGCGAAFTEEKKALLIARHNRTAHLLMRSPFRRVVRRAGIVMQTAERRGDHFTVAGNFRFCPGAAGGRPSEDGRYVPLLVTKSLDWV